jgi:hypothetical protein
MMVRALIGGCLLAILALWSDVAAAQGAPSQDQNANTGNDLFRPPANLFQMMYDYKTAPGSGSQPGSTRDVTTETLNLRMDHSLDLAPMWILALRADLPLLAKNPLSSSNPDGDYLSGIGDADVQALIIHNLDQRWTVGFGARLITPTGDDTLGSGKWQIMPGAGFRYALWEDKFIQLFRAGGPVRRQLRRRSDPKEYQQSPVCADLQPRSPRPLVHHLLSKPGHPHQLRRPDHRSDRPAVPPVRCQDRATIVEKYRAVIRARRADHQGLPGL